MISRGDAHFPSWDLAVERADGHRAVLATLYDLDSITHVERALKETYREATSTDARHPFALRFGPIPESVTCEGDPFDPTSAWDLRVRCARGNGVVGLSIALVLTLLVAAFAIVSMVMIVLAGLGEWPPSLVHVGSTLVPAICMGVLATATRDQFRTTLLEQFGEVHAHLDRGSMEVTTPPWPMDPLTASGTATLSVEPCAHDAARAWLALVESDGSTQRVHAPIGIDAARYLARIVTLRREARLGTRTLETTLDSA